MPHDLYFVVGQRPGQVPGPCGGGQEHGPVGDVDALGAGGRAQVVQGPGEQHLGGGGVRTRGGAESELAGDGPGGGPSGDKGQGLLSFPGHGEPFIAVRTGAAQGTACRRLVGRVDLQVRHGAPQARVGLGRVRVTVWPSRS